MPLVPNDSSKNIKKETSNNKPIEFKRIDPIYGFDELILSDKTLDELKTVVNAQKNWKKVFEDWGMETVLKQRKNLFINLYGAAGTGKTMAAHAIASALEKKMICVNYADIESKYVGETSKNLTRLFNNPDYHDDIIFFDEADALLSKRVTNMSNATDVSVNQTRSVLLTLMNDYKGMIIFATNFISNYDPAFMRRIQYHICFELPDKKLRERLWKYYIPEKMPVNVDITQLSEKYQELSGSDISTAVLKAALNAANHNETKVNQDNFEKAVEGIISSKNANKYNSEKVITSKEIVSEDEVPEEIRKKAKENKES